MWTLRPGLLKSRKHERAEVLSELECGKFEHSNNESQPRHASSWVELSLRSDFETLSEELDRLNLQIGNLVLNIVRKTTKGLIRSGLSAEMSKWIPKRLIIELQSDLIAAIKTHSTDQGHPHFIIYLSTYFLSCSCGKDTSANTSTRTFDNEQVELKVLHTDWKLGRERRRAKEPNKVEKRG